MLVDCHCHINSLAKDAQTTITEADTGMFTFLDVGIDTETTLASCALSVRHAHIYTACGIHPFHAKDFSRTTIEEYRQIIRTHKKIIGIGEVGLDEKTDIPLFSQKEVFSAFLKLAIEEDKTLILHLRIPGREHLLLQILDEHLSSYERCVFHCFSQGPRYLEKVIERGAFVSFSLNVLRKNKRIAESLEQCPLEQMLLETDSPYMKIRDRQSSPLDIPEVYSHVSEVKGIMPQDLESQVYNNFLTAFNLRSTSHAQ